ncbi:hypothetical protein Ae406Ps2_3906c [Pseudonocardia sp. Ae406_Ps2]|nr:hypothetical protein Ae331Ps2_2042 [Pseudonocardia sp. Ae331_Ps2]OLM03906.1 hypothetical protein Ae406Ps2_3906c [Pseudonocardia sp. Ae406_Ps2]OLM25461.1 hypothetical protein Ae706Ps2_3894c [Pseudonocardia sp. Ae706_Ps2]
MLSHPYHLSPDQTLGDLCGCRDHDSGRAPSLAGTLDPLDHDSVMEHLDLEFGLGHRADATGGP